MVARVCALVARDRSGSNGAAAGLVSMTESDLFTGIRMATADWRKYDRIQ